MNSGRLPNFLCIGAPRCGTTWLYRCLQEHPEAFVSEKKEPCFFITSGYRSSWNKGLEWYKSLFSFSNDFIKAWGEMSVRYYYYENTPRLVAENLPDVKLIYLIRHPVEMLYSLYFYHMKMFPNSINASRYSFHDYLDHHLVEPLGFFAKYLKNWYNYFPQEKILVVFLEKIRHNPKLSFSKICTFLGIDPTFTPSSLTKKINPALIPKSFFTTVLLRTLSDKIPRQISYLDLFKFFDKTFNRTDWKHWHGRKIIEPNNFNRLINIYRSDIQQLQEMTEVDLTHWLSYEQLEAAMISN